MALSLTPMRFFLNNLIFIYFGKKHVKYLIDNDLR